MILSHFSQMYKLMLLEDTLDYPVTSVYSKIFVSWQ